MTSFFTSFLPEDFTVANIVVGAKVEAEGTWANGVLNATKISFRRNVKLESDVDTIIDANSFTLAGLPGITVTTNSATFFEVAVTPGAHIRVRGTEGPNNTVLATRIEDRDGSTDAFLQGPVDSKAGTVITILGIPVNTSTIVEFENSSEFMITRQAFLDLTQPGTLVKVKGDLQPGPIVIFDEAELED